MELKSFKIITFGCRVNQAESRLIGEQLASKLAMKPVEKTKKADLVVINTCCVTHKAEKEARKEVRRVKRENPKCFLVVAGCWVENVLCAIDSKKSSQRRDAINMKKENFKQFARTLTLVDLLIENKDKKKIGQILKSKFIKNIIQQDGDLGRYKDKYGVSNKALVKVQEGCDNFCTYCIVPYVKGRSKSRSIKEVVKEIRDLIEQGIKEVILTGTDMSDYRFGLVKLIREILTKTKIRKISFGSINLRSFDAEFVNLYSAQVRFSQNKLRLSSHFHIPLQSGCDTILKRMNRGYKISNFQFLISKLKKKISGFSFSTDIIVGFPGESKKEFEQTLKILKKIKKIMGKSFTKIHVFRYSARQGTVAAKMAGKIGWEKVETAEKKSRSRQIVRLFN